MADSLTGGVYKGLTWSPIREGFTPVVLLTSKGDLNARKYALLSLVNLINPLQYVITARNVATMIVVFIASTFLVAIGAGDLAHKMEEVVALQFFGALSSGYVVSNLAQAAIGAAIGLPLLMLHLHEDDGNGDFSGCR